MSILCKFFWFFILFENIIFTMFDIPDFFGYWDEIFCLVLIIFSVAQILKSKQKVFQKNYFAVIISLVLLIVCGLASNLFFGYINSIEAILRDIVNFIKFPMTFICLKYLQIDKKLNFHFDRYIISFLKILVFVVFLLGVISVFIDIGLSQNEIRHGIKPYQFLFSHPTYLVSSFVMIIILINYIKEEKSFVILEFMMLFVIVLTLRTKAFVIAAAYVYLKYFNKLSRRFKIFGWILLGVIIISVSYYKLEEYVSFSNSPREALYKGSLELLKICFPLGSGFATYGSFLSGKFLSKVYTFIEIPSIASDNILNLLGDAGYAYYIGQFGVVGLVLLAVIFWNIYKISIKKIKNQLIVKVFFVYIFIALTSEAILMNLGVAWAVLLAVLTCSKNEQQKSLKKIQP